MVKCLPYEKRQNCSILRDRQTERKLDMVTWLVHVISALGRQRQVCPWDSLTILVYLKKARPTRDYLKIWVVPREKCLKVFSGLHMYTHTTHTHEQAHAFKRTYHICTPPHSGDWGRRIAMSLTPAVEEGPVSETQMEKPCSQSSRPLPYLSSETPSFLLKRVKSFLTVNMLSGASH